MSKVTPEIRLTTAMIQRDAGQAWLAHMTHTSRATINRLCSGERIPSLLIASRIAKVLNCAIEDLWPIEALESRRVSTARQAEGKRRNSSG